MIRSGWKHGFVAVLIGTVLGLGGLAGQPPAQAAPGSGVNSEGGYSERRPCGDCYDRERACDDRRDAPRRCPDCYNRQPRCSDCASEDRRPCDRCADSAPKNRTEDRCAESKKACEAQGEPRDDDDDDDDRYDRKKKDRSALHKVLRGVFD